MPDVNTASIDLIDEAMSSLQRLRAGISRAATPAPIPEEKMSIAAVEGQSWGAPMLGFMRVLRLALPRLGTRLANALVHMLRELREVGDE